MFHPTFLVGNVFNRIVQGQEFHAFLLGMFHFLQSGRHFRFRTTVNNHRFLRSQTAGRTHRIHGRISTSNHSYPLTEGHRSVGIFTGRIHQVHTGQIFVGRHDVDGVLARDIHEIRQSGTRSHKDSLEAFVFQLFYTEGLPNDAVLHKSHAHLRQVLDFHVHNFVGQTELRNTVFQYPTNLVQGLEYSHIVSHLGHVARERQSRGSRTDHRHLDAVLGRNFRNRNLSAFPLIIGCKTFQVTDGHCFVPHLQVDTLRLTLLFLRTDTSAHSRKCTGFLQRTGCFQKFSTLNVLDEARNINAHRTTFHTGRIGTVQTSLGLRQRLFFVQSQVHFLLAAV